MFCPYITCLMVIAGTLVVGVHGGGPDDDDDDDDDENEGFAKALADVSARVKTIEIERALRTAWCVVKGPPCNRRGKRGVQNAGTTGSGSSPGVNIEAAINRFSQCICHISSLLEECKLQINLNIGYNDHINAGSRFALVFYWQDAIKDFYCYISLDNLVTCSFSQRLAIPISSREEIRNYVRNVQGQITHNSECSEFCSRFRCLYESWYEHGLSTPFNQIYDKCVKQMCSTTPSPFTTPLPLTTAAPLMTSKTPRVVEVNAVKQSHFTPAPSESSFVNHTMSVPGGEFNADTAEQDGDNLKSSDRSTVVGGLVGGLLALATLAFIMFVILFWRKRKHNLEKREPPPVNFVSSGHTHIGNTQPNRHSEHATRAAIMALNPLAASRLNSRNDSQSEFKPLTLNSRPSLDDTYATLAECEIGGPHDNPAFENDPSLNKGEELVLSHTDSNNRTFVLEGLYAKPTSSSTDPNNPCDEEYLEPVPVPDRYVSFPNQYLEPVPEKANTEEYLEPVPCGHDYATSGHSYMRMESAASGRSTRTESVTDDAQYECLDSPEPNYYNM